MNWPMKICSKGVSQIDLKICQNVHSCSMAGIGIFYFLHHMFLHVTSSLASCSIYFSNESGFFNFALRASFK